MDDRLLPGKRQLDFLDWEFGVFFHFGIRSFFLGHKDWDNREMPVSAFNPESLDCEQWIRNIRDAGAKYAVLVCKHHDGFANWPTAYSEYSVKNSPWKDGKGDVVAEYVAACRKYGIKVGLYYSPAQWGGSIAFRNGREYDDYFIAQIGELLTNYGKIDYLWFDGCGSGEHEYDKRRIIAAIRGMQPDILIFSMWDPDTQWIGNEDDYADMSNSDMRQFEGKPRYLPAECDCKLRSTWFDCELNEDTIKGLDELMGMYEMSVGRGSNLLLNVAPNRHGLLSDSDVARLSEFGAEIRRRYGQPVAGFSAVTGADNVYTIASEKAVPVNRVILQEDISEGNRAEEFAVYANLPVYDKRICVYRGCTIGHKAICCFPTIRTAKLTVEIVTSEKECRITNFVPYFS